MSRTQRLTELLAAPVMRDLADRVALLAQFARSRSELRLCHGARVRRRAREADGFSLTEKLREKDSNLHYLGQNQASCRLDDPAVVMFSGLCR